MKAILSLDQGTTSSRAVLWGEEGELLAMGQSEFPLYCPEEAWVEQEPEEIWKSQAAAVEEALSKFKSAHGSDVEVVAMGITNQRETSIFWDAKSGEPIGRALVWQDRRTLSWCEKQKAAGGEKEIHATTGLWLDPYFSASKIAWFLEQEGGGRRARAERGEILWGTVDSWLVWKLSGGKTHVTDASNASRSLLFSLESGDWDEALLEQFQIPRAMLPEVVDSVGVVAGGGKQWFGEEVPIAAMLGDQQAALFGQGALEHGMAKCTYGTGCFLLKQLGGLENGPAPSKARLLNTVAWRRNGVLSYAQEGSAFMCGALVGWLRDGLGMIEKASDIETLAAGVEDNGGVSVVPALAGLGAPYWDSRARGLIGGLTRRVHKGHVARATLEALAMQVWDLCEAMGKESKDGKEGKNGGAVQELRVDGGACRNDLLMQLQADVLGVEVKRPKQIESTALGAGMAAGLGVGLWTEGELKSFFEVDRIFEPSASSSDLRDRLVGHWEKAVSRARDWSMD